MTRPSGRKNNEMRTLTIECGVNKHAEGSCLVKCGDTHVLCTASVETKVPAWMKGQHSGWITAEYGMLPRANATRIEREAVRGKQEGRTHEIQRLIGRSIRAVVDLHQMVGLTIKIDCDVLQADGGTRTASITGAWVAVRQAINYLLRENKLETDPMHGQVAAVSCGIVQNNPVLDLDYVEDSNAGTDANFVMNDKNQLLEIQGTAEGAPFSQPELLQLLDLATTAIQEIMKKQNQALAEHHN